MNMNDLLNSPLLHMGLGILSGNTPSTQPVNPLAGGYQGLMQAQKSQQMMRENQLREMIVAAQMAKANKPESLIAKPQARNYTPESLAAYQSSGDISKLVPVPPSSEANPLAKIDPKDYTQDSFAKFATSGYKDYSVLQAIPQRGQTTYGTFGTQFNAGTPESPKWMERVYGSDGSFQDRPMGGIPQRALGYDPTTQGAVASEKAEGKKRGEVSFDLPLLEQNAQFALDTINKLEGSKGLPYITGWYSMAPIMPGTDQAEANALAEQVKGKTFLEAYQTLKGGGQITEVEGAKAENAIARLDRKQNTKDYKSALTDLREVIQVGLGRARKQAGASTDASNVDDLLNKYK